MSSQFELEREFRENNQPYPGYKYPLEFRPLKISDTIMLSPILRKHGKQLSDFLADYTFASNWDFRNANNYVRDLLDADFPTSSYLFLIGKQVVGMAYIGQFGESKFDVQIVLWVHPAHQGRHIGHNIGHTIRKVCLEVWGFDSFNWLVAETNVASIKTAESLGLGLHGKVTGAEIHARAETGDWRRYVAFRDESKPGGILQGNQSLAAWAGNRNLSAIDAILQAIAAGDDEKAKHLAEEELAKYGNPSEKESIDSRNDFQRALDSREEQLKKIHQKIVNKHARIGYNQELKKRKKRK